MSIAPILLSLFSSLALLSLTGASSWRRPNYASYSHNDGSAQDSLFQHDYQNGKRTPELEDLLCGDWNEICVPDSKRAGLRCCEKKYTCKCNFWNTNCRCKAKLFGGK